MTAGQLTVQTVARRSQPKVVEKPALQPIQRKPDTPASRVIYLTHPPPPSRFFFSTPHQLNFRSRKDNAGLWRSW
ncbi:hypothetical protein GCM10009534_25440 [Kribbella sandramycini]